MATKKKLETGFGAAVKKTTGASGAIDPEIKARAQAAQLAQPVSPFKDSVDMSVITRTELKCTAEDADVVNDLYMALVRYAKIGTGDLSLAKATQEALDAYRGKK